jgi:hypothetical protein
MKRFSEGLTVIIIIALICSISSLMSIEASCADPPAPTIKPDIPKPSVPQFTLTYADHSYDVPAKTTSSTDPYTGKVTTTTTPGYHVKNYTIDVSIKNQPYPPTINNGNVSTLKYFIQAKGHFEPEDSFWTSGDGMIDGATKVASNSEYTVASIPLGAISEGAVDFRVQASLGYDYTYYYGLVPFDGWASADSDWSNIQTISIPDGSVTISTSPNPTLSPTSPQNPTPTPTVPELSWLIILPLFLSILSIVVLNRKRSFFHKSKHSVKCTS